MKFGKLVDKAWEDKTAQEILKAPPSALEGLTEKDDELLAQFGIKTVGDLASWKYARRAAAVADLADTDSTKGQFTGLDGDRLRGGSTLATHEEVDPLINRPRMGLDDDAPIGFEYLSDAGYKLTVATSGDATQGRLLRDAFLEVIEEYGFVAVDRGPEFSGSWWQSITVRFKGAARSPEAREAFKSIEVGLENALLNERQASIDNTNADSVSKLLAATADSKEVVITLGTLILVKHNGATHVRNIDAVTANSLQKIGSPAKAIAYLNGEMSGAERHRLVSGGDETLQLDGE